MKFENKSKASVKFLTFKVKVYDKQGLFDERQIQENNRKFIPEPANFMNPTFPAGYSGVDKGFYRNQKSLMDSFQKIEIELIKVE